MFPGPLSLDPPLKYCGWMRAVLIVGAPWGREATGWCTTTPVVTVSAGTARLLDRRAISMFVSDVNIQPNHKRKPAMPPGSPLFGVPTYAQRARSWVGSGPVIEDVNPR